MQLTLAEAYTNVVASFDLSLPTFVSSRQENWQDQPVRFDAIATEKKYLDYSYPSFEDCYPFIEVNLWESWWVAIDS